MGRVSQPIHRVAGDDQCASGRPGSDTLTSRLSGQTKLEVEGELVYLEDFGDKVTAFDKSAAVEATRFPSGFWSGCLG
jgi:hypothetical protein